MYIFHLNENDINLSRTSSPYAHVLAQRDFLPVVNLETANEDQKKSWNTKSSSFMNSGMIQQSHNNLMLLRWFIILPALNHTPQLTPEVKIPFIWCHHNTFNFLKSDTKWQNTKVTKVCWKWFIHHKCMMVLDFKGCLSTFTDVIHRRVESTKINIS